MTTTTLGWNFDNTYLRLPELFFSYQEPNPVRLPQLVILNHKLAASLGLQSQELASEEGVAILAGNKAPHDGQFLAQAYAGHQFGYFTKLGDGRAVLIGEQITPSNQRYDLQLKGSGPTPYSRGGDGRATLGPMLREYLISEAMHGLGISTSRSLAVVTTGEMVRREAALPGAILTRVASSHLRIGTFQYAAAWGNKQELQMLADYAIKRHYPKISGRDQYLLLLREVIKVQASLVAQWMLVGFIHGVMNTDNMTISGETIDYGPCAFMDTFDPDTVFSSIDRDSRYAYGKQSSIALWNLARLAETLVPLFPQDLEKGMALAEEELGKFSSLYTANWLQGMKDKLGLLGQDPRDEKLIKSLIRLMHKYKADYTNTFLDLTFEQASQENLQHSAEFVEWKKAWESRLQEQQGGVAAGKEVMTRTNPALIPRNYYVEQALKAAVENGDLCFFNELLNALTDPYDHNSKQKKFAQPPEENEPYQTFCGT